MEQILGSPRHPRAESLAPVPDYGVVIPTVGRPSLAELLRALAGGRGPPPTQIVIVDDRDPATSPEALEVPAAGLSRVSVRRTGAGAHGPAAARNAGWRGVAAPWVVFLDDDVLPTADWQTRLAADLAAAEADVVAVQGQIHVPLPSGRRPTDWERATAGLTDARWATADMAYRRDVLVELGGFDERFPRAYREDADLGLRASAMGRIVAGSRTVEHPVRPAWWTASVARQAGNADDVLMRRIHGPGWRERAGAPRGRRRRHALVTGAGLVALAASGTGRRLTAATAGLAWSVGTAELAWRRIAPGPRTAAEVATMVATSVVIPPAAMLWWLNGLRGRPGRVPSPPAAVLFDRDGTLIDDVPYNGDPTLVEPRPGARRALQSLRARGIPVALVSNQSGVGSGRITRDQMDAVNRRTAELLGPFDVVVVCPHTTTDGCPCRKPKPGMLLDAARRLGVDPRRCVMVGDIGSDMGAAHAAGARAVLVPTPVTRHEEVDAAPAVALDLDQAVRMILTGQT